jgi:hypothetical protein
MNGEVHSTVLAFDPVGLGVVIALTGSPEEFAKFVIADSEKWAKVIRTAGIKAG